MATKPQAVVPAKRSQPNAPLTVSAPQTAQALAATTDRGSFGNIPLLAPLTFEKDSYAATAMQEILDRSIHATVARFTTGISPSALIGAFMDWGVHLAFAPGKRVQLIEKAYRRWLRLAVHMARCMEQHGGATPCVTPLPQDERFDAKAWQQWPYNIIYSSFLLGQEWWHDATTGVRGVTHQHENVVDFITRQLLDLVSPSNFLWTNPEVLEKTVAEGGKNLSRGLKNFIEDLENYASGNKPAGSDVYRVGYNLAVTPGKVVYRNRLIELIQYAPATDKVHPEPLLIIPAWIMKYYILDLSPENSLVKYLIEQGFTVFMISWKNPTIDDREIGMSDYRTLGIMDALNAIEAITGAKQIHGVGYCLGGTLMMIAAAAMARGGDNRFKTLSSFAAEIDFSEAGELMLFINESQISFLEDMMWEMGYLDNKQMAGAFQLLRSKDLIWSRMIHDYLMGERRPLNDLLAWNADTTRLPYKMHSEYLRRLFLHNDFAAGRYVVDDRPAVISDIRADIFAVATERDHVAPWRSVFKLHLLADTNLTFLLTSGGHNAGIVSEPGHPRRHYRVNFHHQDDQYQDPETWYDATPAHAGSWWPVWSHWLKDRSSAAVPPPAIGAVDKGYKPLADAPGSYILQA